MEGRARNMPARCQYNGGHPAAVRRGGDLHVGHEQREGAQQCPVREIRHRLRVARRAAAQGERPGAATDPPAAGTAAAQRRGFTSIHSDVDTLERIEIDLIRVAIGKMSEELDIRGLGANNQ